MGRSRGSRWVEVEGVEGVEEEVVTPFSAGVPEHLCVGTDGRVSYLASSSMRSCLLMPSGMRRGMAATHVRNRSIFGFLSPLCRRTRCMLDTHTPYTHTTLFHSLPPTHTPYTTLFHSLTHTHTAESPTIFTDILKSYGTSKC